MDNSPKYDVPWDLITESLTGSLTTEEKVQLQQWLSADQANQEQYSKIKELWSNGFSDYSIFKNADGDSSWTKLQNRLEEVNGSSTVKTAPPEPKRRSFVRWIAVAAVFIGLVAVGGWFFLRQGRVTVYETLASQQRTIELMDGSVVTLKPNTRLEVSADYNQNDRVIKMRSGEAFFDVIREDDKPFVVNLGGTRVRDIGTSFTIKRGTKEIKVAVETGSVEFEKSGNSESRAISAGKSVIYNVDTENFGEVVNEAAMNSKELLLDFNETSLSEAIKAIENVFGKKIMLADKSLASKKITAHLDGMPYSTVVTVICKSLGLDYAVKDSVYILKPGNIEQH